MEKFDKAKEADAWLRVVCALLCSSSDREVSLRGEHQIAAFVKDAANMADVVLKEYRART